jgi:hypothetical protein
VAGNREAAHGAPGGGGRPYPVARWVEVAASAAPACGELIWEQRGGVAHRSLARDSDGGRVEEASVRGSDHGSPALMQRLESIVEPGACSGR